jgi:sensor histidine kinase YesM
VVDVEYIAKHAQWKSSQKISDRYLLTRNNLWVKIQVDNPYGEDIYCRIDNPRLDFVDIYISDKNGNLFLYNSIGNLSPIENRTFKTHRLISKLPNDPLLIVYLRIKSTKRITYPLYFGTADTILDSVFFDIAAEIFYFVILLILLGYNLLSLIRYKEPVYLFYLLSIFMMGVFIISWKGYEHYLPDFLKYFIYNYSRAFFNLSIFFLIFFSTEFLKIKELSPRLLWLYRILSLFFIYTAISIFSGKDFLILNRNLVLAITILSLLSMIAIAVYMANKKNISIRMYLLGFIGNMICIGVFVLPLFGIEFNPRYQSHIIPFGSIIESIFLSMALTQRIAGLKKEHSALLEKSLKEEKELRIKTQELIVNEQKTMEYRLIALRSVMNPHFLFNCLNSIQYYIAKNDRLNAINYLSDFSQLIRSTLNSSMEDKWPLSEEIALIRNFIKLEKIRMDDDLCVSFEIDQTINTDSIKIPSLILQPYIENALEHGLLNKTGSRILKISIHMEGIYLFCIVEDNGIGREAAKKIRKNITRHKSMALSITQERLKLINKDSFISFNIIDLYDKDHKSQGTRVEIKIKCEQQRVQEETEGI